ncbi:unnamed protein product [Rotaria sordida]|uniref:Reverse transcriptase/retrotransposon-derived protein RNase H-like domain-containing protein n=2 Tax=Rotaria sordida TaxID=392033 RepID=A0A814NJJ2_9BILA|nr:unnamed protein product [Rotaria sordida]
MYKIIQELLHFGLIRPSDPPYAAPALLVAKHDGTWGMAVDYKKLNNITVKDNHPLPNMEQAIQLLAEANKFLGALSWYRKFIPKFATIAASIHAITNLTKTNRHKFEWGASQSQAILQLKQLLITSSLFLDSSDDNYPVILTGDASEIGIGGTLQQNINGETKNLYYHSQVTSSTQRRYDPIELEALAIWLCFQRMRSYLLGQHNCLADYLSRHPIQNDEEIFDEDYGISMLFQREPPVTVHTLVNHPPVIGAVVTRSKMKQIKQ